MLELFLSAFLGASLALLAQFTVRRWRSAVTARAVAVALWEELSAVEFRAHDDGEKAWFDGFTSETFDTLFREAALTLPESLFRSVVRYHWKMRFAVKKATADDGRVATASFPSQVAKDGMDQWEGLRPRLQRYSKLPLARLFFLRREPSESGTGRGLVR